jgi:hypothetical protein
VNSPQHSGRNIIILIVLFLALLLPIGFTFSYFQDTLTSDAAIQVETETQNATPLLASATSTVVPPTRAIRTANPAQGTNCTYPATYWLVSPDNWPAEITIGNLYYTQDQAIEFVTARPAGMFNILFIQLHAAYLNILSGAGQSQIVGSMIEASDWLNKTLSGSDITQYEQQRAISLAKAIQAYNDGETGPGRCPLETTSLSLFSNNISAAALSLTPEITIVVTQTSISATRTPVAGIRTPAIIFPPSLSTATKTPTRRSDSLPPNPTTPAPTHQPTATPAPPTSLPPTDTPRPIEPTPTSAPPEEPTPTSPPI